MVILVISLLKNLLSSVVEKTKKLKEAGDGSLKKLYFIKCLIWFIHTERERERERERLLLSEDCKIRESEPHEAGKTNTSLLIMRPPFVGF